MYSTRGQNRRRWWVVFVQAAVLSVMLAIGTTWAGSTYDHPMDRSIVTGMKAPECAEVRVMRAGSLLLARQPDSDVCRSFFLYRTTFPDAANDPHAYMASVMEDRIGEFRQLVGYVCLLWLAVAGVVIGVVYTVRFGYRRYWCCAQRQND
ncbi:hypothetical protein [Paraburkholderia sp. BCC1885]|uniref:hypothetical protein n=1 Tax=Paraburkholderia sp. BCC1885 TaxID=2562669 RepID=UPI001183F7FA|nr:hypothetical protein [Paraburkholderia sp. BCC1885]